MDQDCKTTSDDNISVDINTTGETTTIIWSLQSEHIIKTVRKDARRRRSQHSITHTKYSRLISGLTISLIVLSATTGISPLLQLFPSTHTETFTTFFYSLIGSTTSVIASIIKFSKFDKKENTASNAVIAYEKIIDDMTRQLLLEQTDRRCPKLFINWAINESQRLKLKYPLFIEDDDDDETELKAHNESHNVSIQINDYNEYEMSRFNAIV